MGTEESVPTEGLLQRSQFVHYDAHRRSFRGGHTHKIPADLAFAIDDEGSRTGNPFLWMEYLIGIDESSEVIRQNGKPQPQIQNCLTRSHGRICTQGYDLCIEPLNLFVICLQLAELRLAERSRVHPVKHDQDVLVTFEVIQIDRNTLNGHAAYVRGLSLYLCRSWNRGQD